MGTFPINLSSFRMTIFTRADVKTLPRNRWTQLNNRFVLLLFKVPRGINSPVNCTCSTSKRRRSFPAISHASMFLRFFCRAAFPCPHGLREVRARTTDLILNICRSYIWANHLQPVRGQTQKNTTNLVSTLNRRTCLAVGLSTPPASAWSKSHCSAKGT